MSKKTNFLSFISSINVIANTARSRGVTHLFTEDQELNGREITLGGKRLINFGSCSYLGLETDERLKEGAIDAIRRYGTQFSSSRTYVSFTLYQQLEDLLGKLFRTNVILSSTTTLGHQAVIPIVVEDKDAVIVDHQAHISMQDTLQKLQVRGIPIILVRHNRVDEIITKIAELNKITGRIWYFMDGVYSMYGDLSPINALQQLLQKHKQLHLYIDDAHGMSWLGANGSGYVLSQIHLHPQMIIATSLAKAFGSAGGVFLIPNEELYWRVKNWGGALTYSGPQQPAVIGASVASAQIHLSPEINEKQVALAQLIVDCNAILESYQLPVITPSASPIFFIGLGLPRLGYNMVKRLMEDGLYTNLGIFPAVPETRTGIRFTLNLHQNLGDIERLAERLAYHLPRALQEERRTIEDINRAFRPISKIFQLKTENLPSKNTHNLDQSTSITLQHWNSINQVPKELWNHFIGKKGPLGWDNLVLIEKCFQGNLKLEDNWDFHYYSVTDIDGKPILITFFTSLLTKNDMLEEISVSNKTEKLRWQNPYYQTAKTFMMGTILTEGQQIYLDTAHFAWKAALMQLLDAVWIKQEEINANSLIFRDFTSENKVIEEFFMDQGFVKIKLPSTHIIENLNYASIEEYLNALSSKKRYHIRKDAQEKADWFEVKIVDHLCEIEIEHLYQLYLNVCQRAQEINTFPLPKSFFQHLFYSPQWEILTLSLKPEYDPLQKQGPIAVEFSYRDTSYYPILIGLDYDYLDNVKLYKQLLYQIVNRALHVKSQRLYFGLTASLEKRKLGAIAQSQIAYVQIKDHFELSQLKLENAAIANA